jgi:hypothetical protein
MVTGATPELGANGDGRKNELTSKYTVFNCAFVVCGAPFSTLAGSESNARKIPRQEDGTSSGRLRSMDNIVEKQTRRELLYNISWAFCKQGAPYLSLKPFLGTDYA